MLIVHLLICMGSALASLMISLGLGHSALVAIAAYSSTGALSLLGSAMVIGILRWIRCHAISSRVADDSSLRSGSTTAEPVASRGRLFLKQVQDTSTKAP